MQDRLQIIIALFLTIALLHLPSDTPNPLFPTQTLLFGIHKYHDHHDSRYDTALVPGLKPVCVFLCYHRGTVLEIRERHL
jgi:hypothetical protein